MEWALSFIPNDIEDLTPRQARNKVNPKIVLSIRLGKGVVGVGMPILLEDISFSGQMRIKWVSPAPGVALPMHRRLTRFPPPG
jgi:Ca2+-dependent lipid-binding protein